MVAIATVQTIELESPLKTKNLKDLGNQDNTAECLSSRRQPPATRDRSAGYGEFKDQRWDNCSEPVVWGLTSGCDSFLLNNGRVSGSISILALGGEGVWALYQICTPLFPQNE